MPRATPTAAPVDSPPAFPWFAVAGLVVDSDPVVPATVEDEVVEAVLEAVVEGALDEVLDDVVTREATMLNTSVAESVSRAPSSHTARENREEEARFLVVPTIHVKEVASTWSSARCQVSSVRHPTADLFTRHCSPPLLHLDAPRERIVDSRVINSKGPSVK